jgi:hypothetical protein
VTDQQNLALPASGLYDFDLNDFGVQPDYDKEFLNGKVLIIHGVSDSVFEGDFNTPARSLLHSWPTDFYSGNGSQELPPYGVLMSDDSPAIRQARDMQAKGKVPFVARLRMQASQKHRGQTYWTMERAASLQWDQNGNLVDPNAEPQTTVEADTSAKKGK